MRQLALMLSTVQYTAHAAFTPGRDDISSHSVSSSWC